MAAHVREQTAEARDDGAPGPEDDLNEILADWHIGFTTIDREKAQALREWLDSIAGSIDEGNEAEEQRHNRLLDRMRIPDAYGTAIDALEERLPVFVYYGEYFRVRPNLHLGHLARRVEQGLLDDDRYDYGNVCLLKLLGFSARDLANLGSAQDPDDNSEAFETYRNPLDERGIQLNAASARLTREIRKVWNPSGDRPEADTVRVTADGQYLKVVVEDELGVEIEFDQRSAGFQWLVSFFVVFFAEAADANANAVLLLDEPGLSLHGLKQREFRQTVSRLAEGNQTLYTTHSPFLVGSDELDLVRVVEMTDRDKGTEVHTKVTASDSAALLPLQEALGYDLAQSLFMEERNLILEGLTDYWYLDATAHLLRAAGLADLNQQLALIPATSAGKVVYFATILHANNLKVAALLDSDNAGDAAAKQDTLVHALGNSRILRTGDVCPGTVKAPEIEDLLRSTLVDVAKSEYGRDVATLANGQPSRPIVQILDAEIQGFSKYSLAEAYIRWTQDHSANDFTDEERAAWGQLIDRINRALS
ncbi:MAG: AAA family ATPase [Acidimicrobiaceae bacterium]|nr:AAA family ATPase [Acidimicrobiaceae bacterium]